ncbi:hypothetical protein EDB89DRAFT_1911646 [Lactarius sanguifluus]|nr:hypothetical protein EDB89DRAFT_1911646 [Lactarius sanguifluus]
MSSQLSRKFAFAKMGLLGLCPRLEEDLGDAAAADELAQTFSVALDMVHSAAADAGLDVAVDPEVTALLSLAYRGAAPPLDVPGGYAWLAEYRLQVEAGTMSHAKFEAHRSAILMADPGLGLPSSLAARAVLLPGVLSELFSNQTLQSPALRAATAAPSPSEVATVPSEVAAASVTSGLRSRRPTAEPGPSVDPVPPHGVKCGRDFPLMDVAQIPGYIRCSACIQRKVKCAPFVGSVPPYPCSHCVSAGRECLRPAAGRARGRTGAAGPSAAGPSTAGLSGAAASSSLRLPASAFFGPEVPTSGVALAATVMFWRGEVARNLAVRRALDVQLSFAEWQYAHFLGALVEPDPTTSQPPCKQACSNRRLLRPLWEGAGNAEAMDDAADGAGAGADGVDETSWAGFSANFGMDRMRLTQIEFVARLSDNVLARSAGFGFLGLRPSAFVSSSRDKKFLAVPSYRTAELIFSLFVNDVCTCEWYCGRRPEDVAEFLHEFYLAWDHAEQTAVQLGMPGLTESTRALRTTIEEAAAPHAELEWLLLFPGVFEEHRSWIIRYAAVFSQAQAVVITNVVFGRNIAPLRNPYILAIAEFRDMFEDGVIDLDELQWQEERLGHASLLADIRRRESVSGGDALTNLG